MDVLNRLKTVVTNVLPVGNPITNDFEVLSQRASGGPGLAWKIFDAINKNSKKEASVFIFEKKWLDRFQTRGDKDKFLEMLKRGVFQLTKLRHPKILSVMHTLEDSRESLAFATEPIYTSLCNIMGHHDNLPSPPPPYLRDFRLYDVEMKYGLLQIIEGLSFLHKGAKIMHGNLNPECIFINRFGSWKLAGFEHCILNSNSQGEAFYPYREYISQTDPLTQPKLTYLAPEYGLSGFCDISSDIFSLAVLLYALYNDNNVLNQTSIHDWKSYKIAVSELRNLKLEKLSKLPSEMRDVVRMMLNIDHTIRPDADQLTKTAYFDDVGVVTLTYLDLLVQKDNLQKSHFFKDLAPVVAKLPKRVNLQRVVPSLASETTNHNMVPFILPSLFQVASSISNEEYQKHIFPTFIPLFNITQPLQVMVLFLQNMELMLNKSSQNQIKHHLLSLVSSALQINNPHIQDLCLRNISTFATIADASSVKNTIVPKMIKLAQSQAPLGIKVNCLVCLGKMLEHLDRWYVIDDVIPSIMSIQSKEPAMLMSQLGIYKTALSHANLGLSKEVIACKLLPHLFPLAIHNSLNLKQFNAFMSVIREMTDKVETEQRSKLQQLDSVQKEEQSLQKFAQEVLHENNTEMKTSSSSNSLSFLDAPVKEIKPVKSIKKNLTMEEKESMAKQQEMQLRFQNDLSSPIAPLHNSHLNNTSIKPPTKDLTQQLINNNLSNLNLTPSFNLNNAPVMNKLPFQPNYQPFIDQSTFPSTNLAIQPSYQPFNSFQGNSLQSNSFQSNSLQSNSFQSNSLQNRTNKQHVDTSPFDSINTGITSKMTNKNQPLSAMVNKQPLNSIAPVKQFPAMNQPANQSTLSTQDIQDLLG